MNLIQSALEALDFHLYDRQGHELTPWHHNDDHQIPVREPKSTNQVLAQDATPASPPGYAVAAAGKRARNSSTSTRVFSE